MRKIQQVAKCRFWSQFSLEGSACYVRRMIFHRYQISLGFDIQRVKHTPQLTPEKSVSLHGVSALCFPGYINITQQGLSLLFSWRFVSFLWEWIFMVSCNCHLSNPSVAVFRRDMMLEDEALAHGRWLPRALHLQSSTLNSGAFLLFVSLSLPTDQY